MTGNGLRSRQDAENLCVQRGVWERLQLAELYIVHPDGSGLKKSPGTRISVEVQSGWETVVTW